MNNEQQIAAQGRELSEAKWQLPKKFRLQSELLALPPEELKRRDPEMAALWTRTQEEQAKLAEAAVSPFGQQTPQEMERARSVTIAENLRGTLNDLNNRISAAIISGQEGSLDELQKSRIAVKHALAERWAIVGRYDLAFSEEPDPVYRDHYLATLEAIWRDDSVWCQCDDHRGSGLHTDITVSKQYVKEEVWSLKEGRMVFLLACSGCPILNAVAVLPEHLRQQRSHRQRARSLAANLSPEEAARVLSQRGHTTSKLLLTPKK